MEVAPSARKHGLGDEDILHAIRNAIRGFEAEPEGFLLIGPAMDGRLLEVLVIDGNVAIHAMEAREKFLR